LTLVTAGRVGKPHGLDGSFYVEGARHALPEGAELTLAGRSHRIARRAGTDDRPLIRLAELDDPRPLRGELLLVEDELAGDEWLAADLVGSRVVGLATEPGAASGHVVARLVDAPSCSILELEDGTLIPFVSDAIARVDLDASEIHVNADFLR
jgi:16S rRNA processing protein RimM